MLQKTLSFIVIYILCAASFAYGITTPIPRDYIVDIIPQGHIACRITKTGAYKGIWSGTHRVCQYLIPGSELWVAGYWQCHRYTSPQGVCTGWKWILAHWEDIKTAQLEPDVVTRSGWHTKW